MTAGIEGNKRMTAEEIKAYIESTESEYADEEGEE